jgi:hypothetical protein
LHCWRRCDTMRPLTGDGKHVPRRHCDPLRAETTNHDGGR